MKHCLETRTWNGNVGRKEAGNCCSGSQQANDSPDVDPISVGLLALTLPQPTMLVIKEKMYFYFPIFWEVSAFLFFLKLLVDNFIRADNVSASYPTHIAHFAHLDIPGIPSLSNFRSSLSNLLLCPAAAPSSSSLFFSKPFSLIKPSCLQRSMSRLPQPHSWRKMGACSRIHQSPSSTVRRVDRASHESFSDLRLNIGMPKLMHVSCRHEQLLWGHEGSGVRIQKEHRIPLWLSAPSFPLLQRFPTLRGWGVCLEWSPPWPFILSTLTGYVLALTAVQSKKKLLWTK